MMKRLYQIKYKNSKTPEATRYIAAYSPSHALENSRLDQRNIHSIVYLGPVYDADYKPTEGEGSDDNTDTGL